MQTDLLGNVVRDPSFPAQGDLDVVSTHVPTSVPRNLNRNNFIGGKTNAISWSIVIWAGILGSTLFILAEMVEGSGMFGLAELAVVAGVWRAIKTKLGGVSPFLVLRGLLKGVTL